MGLFDRWRAPEGAAAHTTSSAAATEHSQLSDPEPDAQRFDDMVQTYMARLDYAAGTDVGDLTPAEFQSALTTRLVAQDSLPDDPEYHYITPFAPHIAEVLTLDLPAAVVTLPHERLLATGRHHSALVSRGRTNLARLLETSEVEVTRLGGPRYSCLALVGASPYTASFARLLTEAMYRWLPEADTGNGVVFALPHRHAIVLQTCTTPAETRAALDLVPGHARELFEASSAPVSPHVFHWYHREISCLTTDVGDGALELTTTPLLEGMLGRSSRQAG
ncbi:hypothetical protein [uncultured Phycicoccus sp.]|uniref:hypothetical protein n=1 Tax=uncultured Phycicoccus sp. TaxID=661422 RepID=UPI002616A9D9|nr:hypothetical protein [uncultured Phycicoccus sp.]